MKEPSTALPERLRDACLRLSLASLARPRRALLLAVAVTLLPLPGLLRLRLDTDGRALVPRREPAVLADAAIRERFQLRDPLIVHVAATGPEGIFQPGLLAAVRDLTAAVAALPEVGREHVSSLATEKRDRLLPGSSDSFLTFLDPLPVTAADLEALRRDLDTPAARVHDGILVSADRRAAAVLAGVAGAAEVDRREVYRRTAAAVRDAGVQGARVSVVGAPAAEALLGDHILRDLAWLLPLTVAALAAVLWYGTRRPACVLLALGKTGLCVVWTFAVLACCGVPVYLTTAVLPVILVAMSLADEVHLLVRFQRELAEEPAEEGSAHAAAERTLRGLVTPVVLATATTCAGFLSFAVSPLAPVRAFGLGAALGIAWSLAFSLAVTPALLGLIPGRLFRRREGPERRRALPSPILRAARRPVWTLAGIAAVTVITAAGLARLEVHDGWLESFARDSPFRRDTEAVNRSLAGTHILHLHLPFPPGETPACTDPAVLARLAELEAFLRRQPGVGGVSGLYGQLTALSSFWNPGEAPATVLADAREVRRLLNRFELSPGLLRRRQVVTDGFDETLVTLFLGNANYRDTQALMAGIRRWHREHLAPAGAGLGFAGDVAVSQATIPAIVRTQLLSFPLALATVFAVVAVLYGSPRLALAALLPVTLSAVWLLGTMGWLGIPLGIATSMFFGIALGLGVDSQSIHVLHRYRELRLAGRLDAVARTLDEVGPALLLNTAAVASGFALLTVSSVPANARLGLLVSLALVLGGLLALTGLGALFELRAVPAPVLPRRPSLDLSKGEET